MPALKPPFLSPQLQVTLPRSVHFLGICGRMVGGLALALKERGIRVTGSDAAPAAPMLDLLQAASVHVHAGWSAKHLPHDVEAVVVGVTIPRGSNVELEAALNGRAPVWNATEFLEHYFLRQSENFVVAGTKGKTTTTALLAWILQSAGLAPDYLIGGQVRGELRRMRLAGAKCMVMEGDEYWCGLHHPSPKFLRYHPRHVIVTNLHYDHANIYPTQRQYELAFWQLISLVPNKGSITLNADDERSQWLAEHAPFPVMFVGYSRRAQRRITRFRATATGSQFLLGKHEFLLPLTGKMNALNAALAAVCAEQAGVSLKQSAHALHSFPGVEGRQEELHRQGRTVIYTDEAFHPFAVRALIEALRSRHSRKQRLVFVFQPRYTGGREGAHQRELPQALAEADVAIVMPCFEICDAHKTFSHRVLCRELKHKGVEAYAVADLEQLQRKAASLCRDGDIVVISLAMDHQAAVAKIVAAMVQSLQRRAAA